MRHTPSQLETAARALGRRASGPVAALLALSIVALIVRVLLAVRGGLWRDEALFLFVVQSPSWSAMMDFLRLHESYPPLFYALMRVWLSIAGDSDAAALALPVAAGIALVPVIYVVGTALFSQRIGLLAAGLAAVAPALAEYSAMVRPYSLLPLLALISSYALIRGLENGSRRAWAGYALTTLAMLYTHNWAWLVLAGEWAGVTVAVAEGLGAGRPRGKVVREWLLAQLIIGVGFLPWASGLLYQVRHAGHAPIPLEDLQELAVFILLSARALLQSTILAYPTVDSAIIPRPGEMAVVVLPLLVFAIGEYLRVHRAALARAAPVRSAGARSVNTRTALIILLVVPSSAWAAAMMLSPRSNMVFLRCLVMLAPMLLLAFAYSLGGRGTGEARPLSRAAVGTLVATYCATLFALMQTTRSNARELAAAVAAHTEPTDLVIVAPEWLASSFNRYYAPAVEQIDFPHFGREGVVDFSSVRDRTMDPRALARVRQRIAEVRAAGRRVWLILDPSAARDLEPEDIARAEQSPSFGLVGMTRFNQIRAELVSRYGPPDTSLVVHSRTPKFERLGASLFVPRDGGAALERPNLTASGPDR